MRQGFWDWWIDNQDLPPSKPKPEDADLADAVRRLVGPKRDEKESEEAE